MKYLKLFQNHSLYEAYLVGDKFPETVGGRTVSYCYQQNEVHYDTYVDSTNDHDYIEIGGIKWATMNIGASSITDYGLYFQWGDTQGYTIEQIGTDKLFNNKSYKYTDDNGETMSKYNSIDGKIILDLDDDAARANWGGNWRMPTHDELLELREATNVSRTLNYKGSGIAGLICTDKTDSSKTLFFPASGDNSSTGEEIQNIGTYGFYWTSSCRRVKFGYYLSFSNLDKDDSSWSYGFSSTGPRWGGYSVRAILDEK